MYKFNVTLLQQLRLLAPMFAIAIPAYAFAYYFVGNGLFDTSDGTLYYCSIPLLVYCILPTLLLHIEYLIINFGAVLEIDTENKIATYTKGKFEKNFSFNEVISIGRYTNPVVNSNWVSFSVYRYMRFNLNDGSRIIITSLMVNKIERLEIIFEREKADVHFRVLALVY